MRIVIGMYVLFLTVNASADMFGSLRSRFTYLEGGSLTSNIRLNIDADINIGDNSSAIIRSHYDYADGEIKLTLDEGYIDMKFTHLYLTLGKRRLSFGQGFSFNPTDSINPMKDPKEPDEVREGKEAIIIEIPKELTPTFMLIAGEECWWFINLYLSVFGADINMNYASRDMLFGSSLSKYITEGVELHIEATKDKYLIGTRYTFLQDGIAVAEYFRNKYASKGEYLFFNIRKPDIIRDITLKAGGLYNLDDKSFFTTHSLSYLLRDDVVLSIKANIYNGKEGSKFGKFNDEFILEAEVFF
jgi:hypothetical protein